MSATATPLTSVQSNGHQSSLENFSVRRTESVDAPEVMKLVERATEKCFGNVNVVNIIEKAILSITLTDSTGEVLGFGAFYDYPNSSGYDPKSWEKELPEKFGLEKITPLNTLFLHYFVSKRPYQHDIAREIIRTVFNACVYVQHIILLSNSAHLGSALLENFDRIKEGPKEEKLFHCGRHAHVPQLHIREARPEDSDDLTPLFTQQNKVLTETYGDYFLAELIEAEDDYHKTLVAEVGGLAIGFMCISSEVDVDMLNECFELKTYNFLHSKEDNTSVDSDSVPGELAEVLEEDTVTERENTVEIASSIVSSGMLPVEQVSSKPEMSAADSILSVSIPPSRASESPSQASEQQIPESKSDFKEEEPAAVDDEENEAEEIIVEEDPVPAVFLPEDAAITGTPSAICVQLFCIDERYEMRSIDFMVEVFRRYPDKDYCLVTIPHTIPEFPLLHIFTRCTPKSTSTLEQVLYLFHRSALLQNINVRFGTASDIEGITYIARKVKGKSLLLSDYDQYLTTVRDMEGAPSHGIVAECAGQIMGVIIIRAEMDIEYLRSHYGLEDFIYFTQHSPWEHGRLVHCAISATFTNYTKFILRECLRLCEMSCLYYSVYPSEKMAKAAKPQSTIEALHHLVQIRPRRQIKYAVELLSGKPPSTYNNVPVEDVLKSLPPFSLFHINRKLTLEPKMIINSRIVVVGASDVSVGFLETLVLCPHIHFNNLVLISPEGLASGGEGDLYSPTALPHSLCYSRHYMNLLNLQTSINIVKSKMTSINREEQYISVEDGTLVQYDYLVLSTGSQLAVSLPEPSSLTTLSARRDVSDVTKVAQPRVPPQVTTLDTVSRAENIVQWAKLYPGRVIVYGSTLTAYTTIQALLEGGVSEITMVLPPTLVSCFNNNHVRDIVEKEMEEKDINIMRDLTISGYKTDDDTLTSVYFVPLKGETETVLCAALITVQDKAIDYNTFEGINNSCLVFDGRLVIDSLCHTNDPAIYAAGPLTKYNRALYSDDWAHQIYCSREIGQRLASIMLPLFDPTFPSPPQLEQYQLPRYSQPKKVYAKLPGGYYYLHVSKPQPTVDLQTAMMDPNYGRVLVTGDNNGAGYFRLHLNQYHTVETVTCLTKTEIDVDNICQLYGLQQEYMNSLEYRFDSGLVPDMFGYFREPWCLALYHDRFNELRDEIRELLSHPNQQGEHSISENVCQLVDEDLAIEEKTRLALMEEFDASLAKKAVEDRLFSFLSYNKYHLPHYAPKNMA